MRVERDYLHAKFTLGKLNRIDQVRNFEENVFFFCFSLDNCARFS